jgi:hypothetical protein
MWVGHYPITIPICFYPLPRSSKNKLPWFFDLEEENSLFPLFQGRHMISEEMEVQIGPRHIPDGCLQMASTPAAMVDCWLLIPTGHRICWSSMESMAGAMAASPHQVVHFPVKTELCSCGGWYGPDHVFHPLFWVPFVRVQDQFVIFNLSCVVL